MRRDECGQMVQDVRLAVNGQKPVEFYGRQGGMIPAAEDIADAFKAQLLKK